MVEYPESEMILQLARRYTNHSIHCDQRTTAPSGLHINVRHQSWATAGLRIALVWEYKNVVSRYHWISPIASPLLHPTQYPLNQDAQVLRDFEHFGNLLLYILEPWIKVIHSLHFSVTTLFAVH